MVHRNTLVCQSSGKVFIAWEGLHNNLKLVIPWDPICRLVCNLGILDSGCLLGLLRTCMLAPYSLGYQSKDYIIPTILVGIFCTKYALRISWPCGTDEVSLPQGVFSNSRDSQLVLQTSWFCRRCWFSRQCNHSDF